MKTAPIQIEALNKNQKPPFELLKLADPSSSRIEIYLKSGTCYVAKLNFETIGVMVLDKLNSTTNEIKNIAVKESAQGNGFGKILLQFADKMSREQGFKKLIVATGNSSVGQLALYQKAGFEVKKIEKNFFLKNYTELIFENGIQCKHQIILEKFLSK